jgi:hypothetical protein
LTVFSDNSVSPFLIFQTLKGECTHMIFIFIIKQKATRLFTVNLKRKTTRTQLGLMETGYPLPSSLVGNLKITAQERDFECDHADLIDPLNIEVRLGMQCVDDVRAVLSHLPEVQAREQTLKLEESLSTFVEESEQDEDGYRLTVYKKDHATARTS